MFISTRADDAKKVFINGKFVTEASNTEKLTDLPLAKYAQPARIWWKYPTSFSAPRTEAKPWAS